MKTGFHNWVQDYIARDNVTIKEQDERGEREKAVEVASKIADINAKRQVAKNLKAMGLSNSDVKKATGLTEDEINEL